MYCCLCPRLHKNRVLPCLQTALVLIETDIEAGTHGHRKMSEAPAPVLGSEEEATELDMPEVKIIKFYLY